MPGFFLKRKSGLIFGRQPVFDHLKAIDRAGIDISGNEFLFLTRCGLLFSPLSLGEGPGVRPIFRKILVSRPFRRLVSGAVQVFFKNGFWNALAHTY